jgi:hypothetical protein
VQPILYLSYPAPYRKPGQHTGRRKLRLKFFIGFAAQNACLRQLDGFKRLFRRRCDGMRV